ncbi:hypothetical protein FRC17_005230 [Serendipita sp. 399]|nr:hypothetical protein FRC17_005230 [Serendipita sp. 399]
MFVPVYSMRSLAWTDGHPLPATTFGAFSSLNRLSFTFSPSPVGDFPKRLDSIINADLVTLCPHIVYLALHLCKSSISSIVYKDGVEDALVSFLESWTELHQRRFPVLWIQDDIKPSRWVDLMPAFEAFVDSFELGEIDVLENLPTFPEKMRFLPEPPDTIKRSKLNVAPMKGFSHVAIDTGGGV